MLGYDKLESAIAKWKSRSKRINKNKLYLILVETASCNYDTLQLFDKLPYEHKIILTHKKYSGIENQQVIEGFDGKNVKGEILDPTLYKQVDWKSFLN